MTQGFGFNLDGANITMWVNEAESAPLTDLQIDDCIRSLHEFRELRNRARREPSTVTFHARWREDLSVARVITGRTE